MYSSHHFLYFLASLSGTQWNPVALVCIAEQQLLALALFSVLTGGAEPEVVFCTSYFSVRNAQIFKYSYTRPVSRLNILHISNGSYQGLPARIQ